MLVLVFEFKPSQTTALELQFSLSSRILLWVSKTKGSPTLMYVWKNNRFMKMYLGVFGVFCIIDYYFECFMRFSVILYIDEYILKYRFGNVWKFEK